MERAIPRLVRFALWSLAALVVLVIAGAVTFALTFDPDSLKPRIIAAVRQATGRDLSLEGRIHLSLSLQPTLTVQGVSFPNPPGFSQPQMATLERLDLQLALLPLLQRRIEITRLILEKPAILLETTAQGQPNWQFTPERPASASQSGHTAGGASQISIAAVRVENGTLTWRDGATGRSAVLGLTSLTTSAASPEANLHLAMNATYNGNPFALTGDVGPLTRLADPTATTAWPVQLSFEAAGAKLALNGTISQPEQVRGYALTLNARVPDLAALAPFAPGTPLPPLRDVTLSAQLNDRGGRLPAISDIALYVGTSDLSGTVAGLRLDKLEIAAPNVAQPMQVSMQASLGKAPATLNGTVGIPPDLLSSGKPGGPVPIDLTVQALGSSLTVKGTLGQRPDGRPSVKANIQSSNLDGDALVSALAKPQAAPATAHVPPPSPAEPAGKGRLIPDTPIPFDALRLADTEVKLSIARLVWEGVQYRAIATNLELHDGKLRLDPLSADLPEGHLSGALTADATQAAPPLTLKLTAPALALQPLFAAMGKPDYISGNLELHADLNGAGTTPHAIAASLNGALGVGMANGTVNNRLLGSTIGSVLRAVNLLDLVGRDGTSQVQCFAARLDASHGIATVRALVLASTLITMDGSGSINLGEETLDLHLRPQGQIGQTAVVVPVRVTGTLRAPNTAPDPANAVAANAGTIAGAVMGGGASLGAIVGALGGGQKLLSGPANVNCGAALAAARGEALGAAPAQQPPPASRATPQQKPPNPANLLRKLFP